MLYPLSYEGRGLDCAYAFANPDGGPGYGQTYGLTPRRGVSGVLLRTRRGARRQFSSGRRCSARPVSWHRTARGPRGHACVRAVRKPMLKPPRYGC